MESISEIISRAESESKGKGKEKATKNTASNSGDGTRISPVGILAFLHTAMHDEIYELALPYLSMHKASWEFLKVMKEVCEPFLRQLYGLDYTVDDWELPFMCGHILASIVFDHWSRMNTFSDCVRLMHMLSGQNYDIPKELDESIQKPAQLVEQSVAEYELGSFGRTLQANMDLQRLRGLIQSLHESTSGSAGPETDTNGAQALTQGGQRGRIPDNIVEELRSVLQRHGRRLGLDENDLDSSTQGFESDLISGGQGFDIEKLGELMRHL
ncbi:Ank-repeat protein mbp1 [Fusarium austroafricanum]|uniref:Ank-repeat protein mbp1 n=1 Tax=Fusarium austroafricanum TaxID=2364996 RepID=A0A8H4NWH7_9HYPO|nr:Ank-repeat protein mbp1 [Fusarium austroafricanum]